MAEGDKQAPQTGIDPNVSVPPGVLAAAQAAEAAHAAAYPTEGQPPADPSSPAGNGNIKLANVPIEDQKPQQPAKIVEPDAAAPNLSGQKPATFQSNQQQQPAQNQQQPQSQEDWERRYKAIKGRHDQLLNENRQIAARVGGLEQTLASFAQPQNNLKTSNEDPTLDQITPQEVAEYGEEFLGIVGRRARQELMPHLQRLEQENQQLKRQLGTVGNKVTQVAKDDFFDFMDSKLENWRDVNNNELFLGWLAEVDPYAGTTRHNLLKQAYEANDGPRVLAFFKGFLADEATVNPLNGTGPATPNATNGAGNPPPKVPLETFAAPGRARPAAPSPADEKPVISRGQITAFYAQVSAGNYDGNPAEKLRLENMIFEAQREGRIV